MLASPMGDQGMSWWKAFSTCWPPGQDGCVVWWDAWAAVGTVLAVVVALGLALVEHGRRRKDAEGRSQWIAVALHLPVDQWAKRVARLQTLVTSGESGKILDMVDPEEGRPSVLAVPPEVIELRKEIHELGDIGGAIAQASFLLNELRGKWLWIESGLRGDYEEDELSRALRLLRGNVKSAEELLKEASRRIDGRLRQTQWMKIHAYIFFRRSGRGG
ncbi:hypothetical protein [Stenotrophomonas indicatrix]|uniref:hypothetical protein n=1 Tax=Stenotrophomonas indicatrix TaxID=2045451 RepID=UPI00115F840F|nr:hypothetical protein [Stenotrophomonas indicatrix]